MGVAGLTPFLLKTLFAFSFSVLWASLLKHGCTVLKSSKHFLSVHATLLERQ
jgi:hypothetical protein